MAIKYSFVNHEGILFAYLTGEGTFALTYIFEIQLILVECQLDFGVKWWVINLWRLFHRVEINKWTDKRKCICILRIFDLLEVHLDSGVKWWVLNLWRLFHRVANKRKCICILRILDLFDLISLNSIQIKSHIKQWGIDGQFFLEI